MKLPRRGGCDEDGAAAARATSSATTKPRSTRALRAHEPCAHAYMLTDRYLACHFLEREREREREREKEREKEREREREREGGRGR